MMVPFAERTTAADAYDCLARNYDAFTAGYAYERWIAAIEQRALALGLRGLRALDLACGTGTSTVPLLARGYTVLACDISPGMIMEARRKLPEHAERFLVADMRELPELGTFDLVLCLDDAINYLLSEDELEATFAGVSALLSPTGVFAFDVNSLLTYRTSFAETAIREGEGVFMAWRGEAEARFEPGEIGSATVEIFTELGNGLWDRRAMRHVQRHHPPETVREALARAGLECALAGQHPGARIEDDADDERHTKLLYLARHANADS